MTFLRSKRCLLSPQQRNHSGSLCSHISNAGIKSSAALVTAIPLIMATNKTTGKMAEDTKAHLWGHIKIYQEKRGSMSVGKNAFAQCGRPVLGNSFFCCFYNCGDYSVITVFMYWLTLLSYAVLRNVVAIEREGEINSKKSGTTSARVIITAHLTRKLCK